MSTYLPDTNVLIDTLNRKRHRTALLAQLVAEGHRLACCDVTVAEVYSGMRPHEQRKTDEFISSLAWYNTDLSIASQAGRLRFEYARQGVSLALPDTLIAATALEHRLILITGNRKHFPMPDLLIHSLE